MRYLSFPLRRETGQAEVAVQKCENARSIRQSARRTSTVKPDSNFFFGGGE